MQAAHDGAASGDSVYVESSATSYGGLSCSKKLILIGTGYFLDQNTGLQAFTLPSQVGTLNFNLGSNGSIVDGLSILNQSSINLNNVDDIIIRRNVFTSSFGTNISDYITGAININSTSNNIFILQNFGLKITNNSVSTGILISNNYIADNGAGGDATDGNCISLNTGTVAIIKNNIFRRGTVTAYNSNISNNIMYRGFLGGSGNLISNNIANITQFGTADGNKANVDMASVFELSGSLDGQFKLKTGSPAIGAGYGSTNQNPVDCGMFGGSTPYALSGIPAIPSI
ncbi:hypothetical protein, partial [Mucilaginibacter sp.]|uniref:hypothetical protein n=1 Tax=Mucilaginibacter sp. TaxID=1882438 RepID=UPI00374D60AB